MKNNICLNCKNKIENNFCSACGQRTSTHKFTFNHFFTHDFIHGVLHLDKGFLFTLKELLIRPGHSIREYMQGRRIKHFNYFTLLLIIIATTHFLANYSLTNSEDFHEKNMLIGYNKFAKDYDKIIKLLAIPFWSLITFSFFKKSKQNYVENIVLNLYMLCGMLLLYIPYYILAVFYSNSEVLKFIYSYISVGVAIYFFIFLYQYFSFFRYAKYSLIIRCFFASISILFIQIIIANLLNYIGKIYFQ